MSATPELDAQTRALIGRLPKVELHLHLEGTLEPELAFELAERNGVVLPYASVGAMRAAYDFTDLQSFLDLYYAACAVLVTREDFRDLTLAYVRRAYADNVRHIEPFFDPQTHTARGIELATVIGGILDGLDAAEAEFNITSGLILSFLRDSTEESAFQTLAAAEPWLDRIVAVGLDSTEIGNPPEKFERVFAHARELGLKCVAHAGEEGGPDLVARTLDALHVNRIDHGVRSAADPKLIERLAESGIVLTVCPNSNVRLRVFDTMADSTFAFLLQHGVRVTVNSDDPAYFGGYIGENYRGVAEAFELTPGKLGVLAMNAIDGSFAREARKTELRAELAAAFNPQ